MTVNSTVSKGNGNQWISRPFKTSHLLDAIRVLQACQQLLQSKPESLVAWKYAGKSLLALGQFEQAKQCLTKAHQLDTKDPEITKDIGNILLNLGAQKTPTQNGTKNHLN